MINYTFSENFDELESKPYLEVYKNQNVNHQDYFHHPKFQYACISVFSKNSKCYLLSVYKNNTLIGYTAFRTTNLTVRKINHEFLVPVAFSVAEYNYPIIHKNFIDDFLIILNKALINFNVHFQHIPGFFKKRILDNFNSSFVSRVIDNPILKNFEDDILKASKKRDLVRNKKLLTKKYEVEVNHLVNEISQELLNSLFELHIKRWEKEGISSNFNLNEYKEIYNRISNLKIENTGFPVLSYLKVDGEYLAMNFGYILNKRYLNQIQARTTNNISRSSGSILIKEILEYIDSIGIQVYDMGVGLEAYKYRYANDIETYFNIIKFKNSFSSFVSRVSLK